MKLWDLFPAQLRKEQQITDMQEARRLEVARERMRLIHLAEKAEKAQRARFTACHGGPAPLHPVSTDPLKVLAFEGVTRKRDFRAR